MRHGQDGTLWAEPPRQPRAAAAAFERNVAPPLAVVGNLPARLEDLLFRHVINSHHIIIIIIIIIILLLLLLLYFPS